MARTSVETQLAKIRKQRSDLEKKEQLLLNRTQGKFIEKIVQLIVDNNISLDQIKEALKAGKGSNAKRPAVRTGGIRGRVPPRYRNPVNPEQTWSGRGRAPLWVLELQKCGSIESAVIK
jgi:DNA-binding protein H-NS